MTKTLEFLGREITLTPDFLYDMQRDYWLRYDADTNILTFGLTPAGVCREGGCRSLEFTVTAGDSVQPGDTLAVAVTGKIKYLEFPAGGEVLELNSALEADTSLIERTPYDCWWLARLSPEKPLQAVGTIAGLEQYVAALREADLRAAHGAKGGVSPTCKSVYTAIQQQSGDKKNGDC
jgi:glycine cleavage system H lipoate-binding protein